MLTEATHDFAGAGRFAPSPTGLPHFGTLLAALASYLHARATGAAWLIRVEDIDQTRVVEGTADVMLRTLEALGLEWDGDILYQSDRTEAYRAAFDALAEANLVFPCGCSRKDLLDVKRSPEGPIYPGTCRNGMSPDKEVRSYRVNVGDAEVCFDDLVLGRLCQQLATEVGDFSIQRADGSFAYQLAVVVDDAYQNITQVVRGADLVGSTQRQIYLQQKLGLSTPEYLHFPVILGPDGKKLSKSEDAPQIDASEPEAFLYRALNILGHRAPTGLNKSELLSWAIRHWNPDLIPVTITLPFSCLT